MSTVTFWDYAHSGTAEIAVSLGIITAMDYKIRILLAQTGKRGTGIDEAFKLRNRQEGLLSAFKDQGMDALLRMASAGLLHPGNISDYTASLIQGRLDLAYGPEFGGAGLILHKEEGVQHLLQTANACYDLLMLDTPLDGSFAESALKTGDVVVVVLKQNIRQLETFFEEANQSSLLQSRPYLIVITNYDADQVISIANIRRRFRWKNPILGVPYNREFANSWNTGQVMAFYQRLGISRPKGNAAHYIESIRALSARLIGMMDLNAVPCSNRGA
ncbi:hypothetical protein [Paenibacillus sp. J22TS3]|uniref:hypothetical protein n=1 Tax=Paenibacillus sp. J22TS3 TaxID=2807192 RepID=UPI001B2C793A|nr:hypothetical protein [Paenibacillus sp. J22TS3]GIP19923.1 hypothetical protein J22TS3_01980 [Paenibacillus sp. J22TS3]